MFDPEPTCGLGLGDHRREGTEILAELHPGVERVLHRGGSGIGEDRAVAERARTVFGAPLIPADDMPLRE